MIACLPRLTRVAANQLPVVEAHHDHGRALAAALGVERVAVATVHGLGVAASPHLARVLAVVATVIDGRDDPHADFGAVCGAHGHLKATHVGCYLGESPAKGGEKKEGMEEEDDTNPSTPIITEVLTEKEARRRKAWNEIEKSSQTIHFR